MMSLLRAARTEDLRTIYDMQQGPFRKEVFGSPADPFEQFEDHAKARIQSGLEHYFVTEEQGSVNGFVWFQRSDDKWFTLLWGKWLRTLVYAAGLAGFRELGFDAQHFWVRQKNKRMHRIAEDPGYGFQVIGEDSAYALRDDVEPPLVIVKSTCFIILRDIYFEKEDYYRQQSMPLTGLE